jgi:hypothetical protein
VNVAFKHLEAKLRFGDLSIGQWAGVVGGILVGIGFTLYLSPFGSVADVIVGVYIGAVPASAAFFASLSEFDLFGVVGAWVRWCRGGGRYLPGSGSAAIGYAVLTDDDPPDESAGLPAPELEALWA